MATLSGQTRSLATVDNDFLSELYDSLENQTDTTDTTILELILHQWEERGDVETATGVANEILKRNPLHVGAQDFFNNLAASAAPPAAVPAPAVVPVRSPSDASASASSSELSDTTAATTPQSIARSLVSWAIPRSSATALPVSLAPVTTDATGADEGDASTARRSRLRPAGSVSLAKASTYYERPTKAPLLLEEPPQSEVDTLALEDQITHLLAEIQQRATDLEIEIRVLAKVGLVDNEALSQNMASLKEGVISPVVLPPPQARPVRQLVSELEGTWEQCLQTVVDDFVQVAQWALDEAEAQAQVKPAAKRREPGSSTSALVSSLVSPPLVASSSSVYSASSPSSRATAKKDTPSRLDTVRERLRRRQTLLDAMLPETLEGLGRTAVLHVEHELVLLGDKTYANSETMLGDDVADIPPENLLVTADNYAWDMSELADALAVNSAVMRNPLTRDMFADEDVSRILGHPLGERLKPMALAQSELRHGVRPDTIARVAALSKVMLEDQSAHATPTLEAIDVFLAYFQTLPSDEKDTLKKLSIPARDSHTNLAYDSSILEAVQDAKANRVCFHKAGDFLKQAAAHLESVEDAWGAGSIGRAA